MPDTPALTDVLACPRCDRALEATADAWHCAGCRVDFPSVAGIPWLFAEPAAAFGEWRGRLDFGLAQLGHETERLGKALEQRGLSAATRRRLEHLRAAQTDHAERLRALLEPLAVDRPTTDVATYLALRTRLPADQGLTTYYPNLHRDWAWGDEENAASLACVVETAGNAPLGRTLVLGAGAGRLAYDLSRAPGTSLTVAADFNPLLVLAAARIARGEQLELYEFPIAPRSIEETAVLRTLAAPAPAASGTFELVLADAHRPPFAAGAFDTVVTPWLVDILPEPFAVQCARVNALLADGGRWINFGSLSFHGPEPADRLSLDECVETVAAHGFAPPAPLERTIPYMCSPASRHGRRETVVAWSAHKTRKVKRPPRHEALPDWLVRGAEPVPLLDAFRMQAMSTRVHAYIMSLIDGRRSLRDMAGVLVEQKILAPEEAEPTLRNFLIKMYDESRRVSGY